MHCGSSAEMCPGRFGIEGLGGLGPAKPRHRSGLGPTKLGLQRIGPREAEPHSYSGVFLKGIRGNDNDGRGGESRWLHQAYFAQRDLPNGSRQGGMARFVLWDPSSMAGFVQLDPSSVARFAQWSHHAWPDSPGEAIERGGVRPAGSVERGKIRSSCMI